MHSVTHIEFLSLLGQFIQCFSALLVGLLEVCHQILEEHPASGANFTKGDFALFQELDQVRPGDIKEVRSLLGGEFGMMGYEGDSVTLGHMSKNID
jgi:hypothetical protein